MDDAAGTSSTDKQRFDASEARYKLLVSAVKDYAIFLLDPTGHVVTWNEGARRLKGYEPDEIIGSHFSRFYPPEDLRTGKPAWELEEATLTGRFEDEGWRLRKDGTRFWANVIITSLHDEDGVHVGFSKVTRDMTERRRLEEKLRRSNEDLDRKVAERTGELEAALRARSEFMSVVSHELRTPLTSLTLDVQLAHRQLKKNDPVVFQKTAARFIESASVQLERLSKLIEDMLDVSRISIDKLAFDMQTIDLGATARAVCDRLHERFESANVPLKIIGDKPILVVGDEFRLEQVLSNLLVNALKYGNGKPVEIVLDGSGPMAVVSVRDHCLGIKADDYERIFQAFERADSTKTINGLGLGLYISQKIIERHSGKITVESAASEGTLFSVLLPKKGGESV